MWQARIDAFKVSGESSVKTWCAENNISYQSMCVWLKKDWPKKDVFQHLKFCSSVHHSFDCF
ncbi:IS66 family insertion sequence element accessory protein TnpA [Sporosarcina limicola]